MTAIVLIFSRPFLLLTGIPASAQPGTPLAKLACTSTFADAQEQATSDFERGILADDIITATEYHDTAHQFVTCIQDSAMRTDLTVETDPLIPGAVIYRGMVNANVPPVVQQRIVESCTEGTTTLIEPLAIAIIVNPEHADFDELVLSCLHGYELVATDFEAREIPALRDAASKATSRVNPSAIGTTLNDAVVT